MLSEMKKRFARKSVPAVLAVLTLAPIGVAVVGNLPERSVETVRPAAGINDLANEYAGKLYSSRDTEFQNVSAALAVGARTRNRLTATLTIDEAEPVAVPLRGTVSASGRIALNGSVAEQGLQVTVRMTGQLSADGGVIVGTYHAIIRGGGERAADQGSIVLERLEQEP